jgi:hypothetical protein
MIAITREEILCHEPQASNSHYPQGEYNTVTFIYQFRSEIITEVKTEAETSFLNKKTNT